MSRQEDFLKTLSEDQFRRRILIPLLQAMGYRDVDHYHGPDELGKDVVAWKEDGDGTRRYVAVVAKAGNINARASGDAQAVYAQVRQAFGSEFLDKTAGETRRIHEVIVAATGTIKERSMKSILDQTHEHQRRDVRFWDRGKVAELMQKFVPELTVSAMLEDVRKHLGSLQHFNVTSEVGPGGVVHRVKAKGSEVDFLTGVFTFPKTPDGESALQEVQRFFDEGGEVTIPGEFIESVQHHEELAYLFGNEKPAQIQIGQRLPRKVTTLRLEVDTPTGPLAYEGLDLSLVKSGKRRAEFHTGDGPFQLRIVFEDNGRGRKRGRYNLQVTIPGQPARRARQAARVWGAACSGAALSITDARSGRALFSGQKIDPPPLPDELVRYLDDLVYIEDHLGWELALPDEVLEQDLKEAGEIRQILEFGSFVEPFDTFSVTLTLAEHLDIEAAFPPGEKRWVKVSGEGDAYEILGRRLPLGPGYKVLPVMLTKDDHERIKEQVASGSEQIEITFKAAPDAEGVRTFYSNYLPGDESHD